MSTCEKDSEDSDWTTQNIQSLLSEMKRSVPEEYKTCSYIAGMKFIQWENVAFPPFSAEACQAKWKEILQKIRKTRSLTELINEAEETLSNPINQVHYMKDKQQLQDYNRKTQVCRKRHQESGFRKRLKKNEFSVSNAEDDQNSEDLLPVKPPSTGYNLFCKEQVKHIKGVPKKSYCIVLAQRWKALTENQRKEYSSRCKELKRQYKNGLNCCLMMGEEKQTLDQSDHRENDIPDTKHHFAKINQKLKQLSFKEKEDYRQKQNESTAKYSMELQQCFQGLSSQEQDEYLIQNPSKHQYLNAFNTAVHKEFTHMPSDSEDEDITDDSSNEELYFDSGESEEEEGEDEDMPFMF